jgi:hypothetical protein
MFNAHVITATLSYIIRLFLLLIQYVSAQTAIFVYIICHKSIRSVVLLLSVALIKLIKSWKLKY